MSDQPRIHPWLLVPGLIVALLSPALAAAQTPASRWELAAGYSFLGARFVNDFPRRGSPGVEAELDFNVNRWFTVLASMATQRNTSRDLGPNFPGVVAHNRVSELMAGTRFGRRTKRVAVFGQVLVGLTAGHSSLGGFSDRGLSFGGGGGVDVWLNRRLAVRGHVEQIGAFVDIMETDWRWGADLVVRLGR